MNFKSNQKEKSSNQNFDMAKTKKKLKIFNHRKHTQNGHPIIIIQNNRQSNHLLMIIIIVIIILTHSQIQFNNLNHFSIVDQSTIKNFIDINFYWTFL